MVVHQVGIWLKLWFNCYHFHSGQAYYPGKFSKLLWLIFFSGSTETIGQLYVPYDCEFILVSEEDEGYKLFELYAVKNKIILAHFGEWNNQTGLKVSSLPFYRRRYNFHGVQLIMLRFQEVLGALIHTSTNYR